MRIDKINRIEPTKNNRNKRQDGSKNHENFWSSSSNKDKEKKRTVAKDKITFSETIKEALNPD